MGKAGAHCDGTNSVEMDSAGRGTGVRDVEAGVPAMAREMGMLVPPALELSLWAGLRVTDGLTN